MIDTIKAAEDESERTVQDAHKDAVKILEQAQIQKEKRLDAVRKKLEEERVQTLAKQKEELKTLYRRIKDEGIKDAEKLKIKLGQRYDTATASIVDAF
jgi:vacuolar-type H+-ATPase subunit H